MFVYTLIISPLFLGRLFDLFPFINETMIYDTIFFPNENKQRSCDLISCGKGTKQNKILTGKKV